MIEFKVISSPDKSQLGSYRHGQPTLTLGNSEADMILDDPQLAPTQVKIFFKGAQAYIENLEPDIEVRVNGKPCDGTCPIKPKDNITMGKCTINLLTLDSKPTPLPEKYEHPQASVRFANDTAEKAILDALDYMMNPNGAPSSTNTSGVKPPPPPKSPPPLPRK